MSSVEHESSNLDLDSIAEPQAPTSTDADAKARNEERDLERQQAAAQLHLRGVAQDIEERKTYAKRIYYLVVGWITGVGIMLFAQGFKFRGFELSDGVLIAAIMTTTASVVGIFLIVTSYLFPKRA